MPQTKAGGEGGDCLFSVIQASNAERIGKPVKSRAWGLAAPAGIHLWAAAPGGEEGENENPHWLCQTARLERRSLRGGN